MGTSDILEMTLDVAYWIDPMIPRDKRDPMNTCIKMTEEVSELMHAMHTKDGNIGEECADVLVLLLDVALLNGVNIAEEFEKKMAKNRNRTWAKKNGALKHENSD